MRLSNVIATVIVAAALSLSGKNAKAQMDIWLSEMAETEIRIFNANEIHAAEKFQEFLNSTPMQNGRSVPERMVTETSGRLRFQQAYSQARPTYFVATYFDKLHLPTPQDEPEQVDPRYGELLYPQTVCPVFATSTVSAVRDLLSTATGLPSSLFDNAPGRAERLHELFLLTEASHCGFLARVLYNRDSAGAVSSNKWLASVIEATGDIEATAALRAIYGASNQADEGDVLLAARVLSTFLSSRADVYAPIPAFYLIQDRTVSRFSDTQLAELEYSVGNSRQLFQRWASGIGTETDKWSVTGLQDMAATVATQLDVSAGDIDSLTARLLQLFPLAVRLLDGTSDAPMVRLDRVGEKNITLPGIQQASN